MSLASDTQQTLIITLDEGRVFRHVRQTLTDEHFDIRTDKNELFTIVGPGFSYIIPIQKIRSIQLLGPDSKRMKE